MQNDHLGMVEPIPFERRCLANRRQTCPLFTHWRFLYRGRRRTLRRAIDHRGVCLDWHPVSLWVITLGTFLLSGLDAVLTLALLKYYGATEANPILRPLVEHDVGLFVNVKLIMTGIPLVLLVAHSGLVLYRKVKVERVIYGLFLVYLGIIGYELILLNLSTIH